MWVTCQIHTLLVVVLLMSGFVLLDIILINIGHKGAGILGLSILPLVPVWYFAVSYAERTGKLRAEVRINRASPIELGRRQEPESEEK